MNPSDLLAVLTDLKAEQERLFAGAQQLQTRHFEQFSDHQVGVESGLVLRPVGAGTPPNPHVADLPTAADWPPGMQLRLSNCFEGITVRQTVDEFGMDAHLTVTADGYIASTLVWAQLDLPRQGLPAGYHALRETRSPAPTLAEAFAALRSEIDDLLAMDNPFAAVGPPAPEPDAYSG
ncbi:hypothetical protein ACFVGY_35335 [Streptomyces sp. NPDC127106]|uniref:hypothetical protein n=1 Tax=Streptomyces sp. NPDC127106 TaxID=3345360 RepID=UPI00362767D9